MKYTQTTLDKLETIVKKQVMCFATKEELFKAVIAYLEEKKVVVLNKFLQTEGRINTLIDLIPQLEINTELLIRRVKKIILRRSMLNWSRRRTVIIIC